MEKEKSYRVVASGNDVKIEFKKETGAEERYSSVLKDFVDSGESKWQIEWLKEKPKVITAVSWFRKLTGKKGKYAGKVKVHHSKDSENIYFERMEKKPKSMGKGVVG